VGKFFYLKENYIRIDQMVNKCQLVRYR